jgi:hypothetical protein
VFFKRKSATLAGQAHEPTPHAHVGVPRQKLSWFEKRERRRRSRKRFEEVLGWILVPAFIYLIYLGVKSVGGIPKELIDFGNELIGLAMKGGR